METNLAADKSDLAKAKRDLLLRFIKDQEELQTRQVGMKVMNNDETFDILDAISKDSSNNNGGGIGPNSTTHKLNEHGKDMDEKKHIPRSQTCIPNFRAPRDEHTLVELKEDKLHYRLKSGKKLQERTNSGERPSTEGSLRRLRSASTFSGRQSRNILRSGDMDVKTRKMSSLSIVVPKEGDIDKLTRRRPSLTCAQVTRPRATVGISAVDVELFDKHTVPSIAGPYTMFHLPPIASDSVQTPPST